MKRTSWMLVGGHWPHEYWFVRPGYILNCMKKRKKTCDESLEVWPFKRRWAVDGVRLDLCSCGPLKKNHLNCTSSEQQLGLQSQSARSKRQAPIEWGPSGVIVLGGAGSFAYKLYRALWGRKLFCFKDHFRCTDLIAIVPPANVDSYLINNQICGNCMSLRCSD